MVASLGCLPRRLPEGTKYIVEGRGEGIFSRYIELPDGTTFEVNDNDKATRKRPVRRSPRRATRRR